MPIPNPKYVAELNELAELCTDSAEAYRRAVQSVGSADLAAFCKRCAEERELMADQFRLRIEELSETVDEGGTLRGAAERLVSEAKSLVGDDEEAILTELVRLEGRLRERFEDFLDSGLPAEAESMLKKYYGTMSTSYRNLCAQVSRS